MAKIFLLGANKEIDTDIQTVAVNQIIQMEGYSYDRYVVYEIYKNEWGVYYKLINIRTKDLQVCDMIRPLSEKFGIGYYYDEANPQFMDGFEVAILLEEAQTKAKAEANEPEKERTEVEEVKKEGKEGCTMVEYSDKAIAVFGDTKSIKEELKVMGGRFNNRLTFNGQKIAGWIFPKSKEQRLAFYFGLD